MTMHNKPEFNTDEIRTLLLSNGFNPDIACQTADAFRLGWLSAQPGYVTPRCADCDCPIGGAQCYGIKGRPGSKKRLLDTSPT